ncbi:Arc-like DNA binding domain protein [compost metagenome]
MKPLRQAVYSSRTADKFVVRLPDGMRETIAQRARVHHRSMNSEIIAVLEKDLAIPVDETAVQMEQHTNPTVTTPVSMGMLAYYRLEDTGDKYSLAVITGISVNVDDDVWVTFDKPPKPAPAGYTGPAGSDGRRWIPIANIKPFLI